MVCVCHLLFDSGYRNHEVYPASSEEPPPLSCEALLSIPEARCLMPSSGRRVTRKDPCCFVLNVNHFLKEGISQVGGGTHRVYGERPMTHRRETGAASGAFVQ